MHSNLRGEVTARHVPAGDFTRASFGIRTEEKRPLRDVSPTYAALTTKDGFSVEVEYADLAGVRWLTRVAWQPAETPEQWELVEATIRESGRMNRFYV